MKQRQIGGIVILAPKGYLTGGDETEELEQMRSSVIARKEVWSFREEMRLRTEIDPAVPHVIRIRVPRTGVTGFHDLVKGDVVFEHIKCVIVLFDLGLNPCWKAKRIDPWSCETIPESHQSLERNSCAS